jgi:hypothetical protein
MSTRQRTVVAERLEPVSRDRPSDYRFSIDVIEYDRDEPCGSRKGGTPYGVQRIKCWRVRRSVYERAMRLAEEMAAMRQED